MTAETSSLQSLGDRARAALESVTAQDPEHLKALSSYLKELEGKYASLLETLEGDEEDEDEEEDPEALDADIVFNTRDWHKGGIATRFHDAPSAEEGEVAEVEAFPVFYPADYQPVKDLVWNIKASKKSPSKPSTLVVDYGAELEELKKHPLFRGFKVLVHMATSDDEDEEDDEEDEAEANE